MLAFLLGTHPRAGKDSDIQVLHLGRVQARTTNPLIVIYDILISTDDQAGY